MGKGQLGPKLLVNSSLCLWEGMAEPGVAGSLCVSISIQLYRRKEKEPASCEPLLELPSFPPAFCNLSRGSQISEDILVLPVWSALHG